MAPAAIVETLGKIVPGFAEHWARGDSHFIDVSGGYTPHGVFAEASHFVRDNFGVMPVASIQEVANFVSDCFDGKFGPDVSNAAATCFLENLSGEPFHDVFRAHLRPPAQKYYDDVVGI